MRLACGNGLGAAVWPVFEKRFAIPRILEYYAATEATFSLYNCAEKIECLLPPISDEIPCPAWERFEALSASGRENHLKFALR